MKSKNETETETESRTPPESKIKSDKKEKPQHYRRAMTGKRTFCADCNQTHIDMVDELRAKKYREVSRSVCFRYMVEDAYREWQESMKGVEGVGVIGEVANEENEII